ncbi:MAG: UPF0182 family protein [Chloroflexi bacterium]|nr:UPF0182 family protein [Chloroflexota bacterium]
MSFFDNFSQSSGRRRPPWAEVIDADSPPRKGGGMGWIIVPAIVFVLFLFASMIKSVYTEWLWYDNLGFSSLFFTPLLTKSYLFLAGAGAFFVLAYSNLWLARRISPKPSESFILGEGVVLLTRTLNFLILGSIIGVSLIMGSLALEQWEPVLRFLNARPFGVETPVFGGDVSFYAFTLPLYRFVEMWLAGSLILVLIGTLVVYGFNFGLNRFTLSFPPVVKGHLSALGALIFLLLSWGYWLDIFDLVYSRRGVVFGASYTDVNAQRFAFQVLMAVTILIAVLLVINVFRRGVRLPLAGVGLWIATGIIFGGIYPGVMQKLEVEPNELAKERPYIEYNIAMTRAAFGLERIEERDFDVSAMVTAKDIEENRDTVNNIRVWDYRPAKDTYNQTQSIRLYYDFHDIDIDRYTIDGRNRQVLISARELSPQKLASQAQTWVNQRLQFTHGYGVAMSPVNEFTTEGLPAYFVKDVPPTGAVNIDRPEVYYGEGTINYVIANTRAEEFDYPKGDANVYTRYQGKGDIKLDSFLKKFIFAWEMGDFNIVLSSELTPESRLLYRRDIQGRVRHIAPFLTLDKDPYIVVADGKLSWIQDAYFTSGRYPYSQPVRRGLNYIRNSVKVVISAYDGTVTFYLTDPTDALAQTYGAIFPNFFAPISEMPNSLRSHLRYPEDLFSAQAEMYRTYHMRDPQVFYNREDLWALPIETVGAKEQPVEPYYVIMRLEEETKEEFLLLMPFTPSQKDNMITWLAARNDGEHYGKLLSYKFPKDRLVFGPRQIEARMNQDTIISAQLTLWSQAGSQVIRGNLLVIPIGKSLLYVEPIYLQAEKGRIPELKRIVVASGNRIVMEETLDKGLVAILGGAPTPTTPIAPPPPAGQPPATAGQLARSAQQHYQRAQDALKAGDWATYGQELKAMADDLARLVQLTGP